MSMKEKQDVLVNLVMRMQRAPAVYIGGYCDEILKVVAELGEVRNVPTKPARRHIRVLDALNETGGATVEHIAGLLRISPATVRLYLGEIRELNLAPVEHYGNRWWLNWEAGNTAGPNH